MVIATAVLPGGNEADVESSSFVPPMSYFVSNSGRIP